VLEGDPRKCLALVAESVHQGRDLNRLSRDLVEHFRNLLVARVGGNQSTGSSAAPLLDLPDQEIADLTEQTKAVSLDTLLDYFDFMVAGDEEVARAATPRFALETVLIRLATLPQSLPVAQLVERLERLEGKAAASAKPQSATARPSAIATAPRAPVTSAGPSTTAVAPTVADVPRRAESVEAWRDFVAFVGKEQKFLASHLESGAVLSLPPGQLKIAVTARHHLAFLQDGDNLATLKDLARRFFAQEVSVQIASELSLSALGAAERGIGESASPVEERSDMVKEALRIFGGSIRNVRREN